MKRNWKVITSALAVATALVVAPLVATSASAEEVVDPTTAAVEEVAQETPAAPAESEPAVAPVEEVVEVPAEPVAEPVAEDPAPVVEDPAPAVEAPVVEAPAAPVAEVPAAPVEEAAPQSQPDFICDESGDGWQAKVDWDGDGNPVVTAPEGYLIDAYCVKAGTEKFIIEVDPPAASVEIDHPVKDSVSHYQIHLIPVVVEPYLVVPNMPVVKDLCETENDHYGLPDETAGVEYTRDGLDIIATITAYNTTWGILPEGWVAESDTVARYAFNVEQFTDENCEDEVPLPALFNADVIPPTCDEAGALFALAEFAHVTLSWDRPFDGPGTYTLYADTEEGYEFPDGTTHKEREVTVEGALGYQSEDPEADCYVEQPKEVTLAGPVITDECGTKGDFVNLPENTEGVTYYWLDEEDESNLDIIAVVAEGYVVKDLPAGWTEDEENAGTYVYDFTYEFSTEACPTPPPPPVVPPVTPPTPGLAVTGGGDVNPAVPLAAGITSVLGMALILYAGLRRRIGA